ncbi:MAG: NAD(P)/FAD-dependent oxidoreductase [Actinomycetota bacterium]|nr:NAD(P)/FAD-dependent oxidoreductase [Actinomycetota bacterium]
MNISMRDNPAVPPVSRVTTALVGGGPAAFGVLAELVESGRIEQHAQRGMQIVSAGPAERFGAGRLGDYLVRSDTRGRVFVECALPHLDRGKRCDRDAVQTCETDDPVDLPVAADLLARAGRHLLRRAGGIPEVTVRASTQVTGLRSTSADGALVELATTGGTILADEVLLALGGRPWAPSIARPVEALALHSNIALQAPGMASVLHTLSGREPRVTIVGGAHSAFAVAGLLLRLPLAWSAGSITVLHRRPVVVTYPDTEAARADGVDVRVDCVCPDTGIVHRFGGLRADSAALFRRVRDGDDQRVHLVRVDSRELHTSDPVVIAATGYRSRVSDLVRGSTWDGTGRLSDRWGRLFPGVRGMGLGTARPHLGSTGGEPEFTGSVDGVWFYRNVVAPNLVASSAPALARA